MTVLRSRIDVILVLEKNGKAVQYDFYTTLKDQLEVMKRWPKAETMPQAELSIRLIYVAAQRNEMVDSSTSYDDFVDMVLDLQVSEAPPLVKG